MLSIIDNKWREHLAEMDYLRAGIGLRAMGQRDPLVEYQREGFDLFSALVDTTKSDALRYLYRVQVKREAPAPQARNVQTSGGPSAKPKPVKVDAKVGRNSPCPCGSGKKYKMCHGSNQAAGAVPTGAGQGGRPSLTGVAGLPCVVRMNDFDPRARLKELQARLDDARRFL